MAVICDAKTWNAPRAGSGEDWRARAMEESFYKGGGIAASIASSKPSPEFSQE
jgi:hypothetical protein